MRFMRLYSRPAIALLIAFGLVGVAGVPVARVGAWNFGIGLVRHWLHSVEIVRPLSFIGPPFY